MNKASISIRNDLDGTRHVSVALAGGRFSWVTVQFDGSLKFSKPVPQYIRAEAERAAREAHAHNQAIWEAQDSAREAEKRRHEATELARHISLANLVRDRLWYDVINAGTVLDTPDGPRLSLPPALPDSAVYAMVKHIQTEIDSQLELSRQAAEDRAKAEYDRGYKTGYEDTYGVEATRLRLGRLRDYNHISPSAWAELDRLPDAYLSD